MGFAKSFAKNALFYLNCVYGLVGLFIGVLGFVVMVKWIFSTAERDRIGWSWLFYVMAGVLMAVTAFFGCYAAVKERRHMLIAECVDSPFEVWTGFHAFYFCSAFHDGSCGPNQDGMFRKWHIPTCIVSIGVPLIEVISSCVALFLAIYLEITKRRSRAAVTEKTKDNLIPEVKQALVSC